MNADLEQLKELYDLMLEKNLDALEIKDSETRIKLTRRQMASTVIAAPSVAHHPAAHPARGASPASVPATSATPAGQTIDSPLAGMFYRQSSPTSAPFVKEGDVMDPAQTLCIVEAMKVMNEIKAESRCKVLKILAENGRSVTAGQPLFLIEPA